MNKTYRIYKSYSLERARTQYLRDGQGSVASHIIKSKAVAVNVDLGPGQQTLVELVYQFLILLAQQLIFYLFLRLVEWHGLNAPLHFEYMESVIRLDHFADSPDFERRDLLSEHWRKALRVVIHQPAVDRRRRLGILFRKHGEIGG